MRDTSALLTYLHHRIGAVGVSMGVVVVVAIAIAAILAVITASQLLAVSTDPVQVAPLRWLRRF